MGDWIEIALIAGAVGLMVAAVLLDGRKREGALFGAGALLGAWLAARMGRETTPEDPPTLEEPTHPEPPPPLSPPIDYEDDHDEDVDPDPGDADYVDEYLDGAREDEIL